MQAGIISPESVAVVSGSSEEPELGLVAGNFICDFLDYGHNPDLYDLNLDWSGRAWRHLHNKYDLVLCEQVLEHVKNPAIAVKNLALLLRPGGHLHVSVPAINNIHGMPNYFYAGFPPQTLSYFCDQAGLCVVEASSWASDKGARMYATCDWSPIASCGSVRFFAMATMSLARKEIKLRDFARVAVKRIKNVFLYPGQKLLTRSGSRNSVISWVIATKC